MLYKVLNIIKFIDLFGHTPSFVVNQELKYKTIFGGILSIIILILGLILLIFFSIDLFARNSPSINLSTNLEPNPTKLYYFDNFEFIIGVNDENLEMVYDESIFNIKAYLYSKKGSDEDFFSNPIELDLVQCNEVLSTSINYRLFQNINLQNYFCISNKQNNIDINEIYINEFWGNNNFQMIQLRFTECQNTTNYTNCKSHDEIINYLNYKTLSIYIVDNYVSTQNYKKPFARGLKEYFFYITPTHTLSLTQYIHHVIVQSDDGLIFTTNKKQNAFQLHDMINHDISYRTSDAFIDFSFQLRNFIVDYKRKYYKFQELIAQVGGVFSCLNLITVLILRFYSSNVYFEFLINNHFEVRLDEFMKKNNNILAKKKFYSKEKLTSNSNKIFNNDKNLTKNKEKDDEDTNNNNTIPMNITLNKNIQKRKQLKLSFFDKLILLNLFPKCSISRKNEIDDVFKKGKQYIMEYIDVISYLRNTHSGQMRSNLILNEDQKKVFDYIFKPILSKSFLGTRYNNNNISQKIKDKLLGHDPDYKQLIDNVNEIIPKKGKTLKKLKKEINYEDEYMNSKGNKNSSSDND